MNEEASISDGSENPDYLYRDSSQEKHDRISLAVKEEVLVVSEKDLPFKKLPTLQMNSREEALITAASEREFMFKNDPRQNRNIHRVTVNEEALIAAVAEREFLYNKNDPRHSNRGLIRKAWQEVADHLELHVEVVKRKWVNLRDYFLRLIRADVRSGQSNPKRRRWMYYEPMSFLLPFVLGKDGNFPSCWDETFEEDIEQKSQESLYELPGPSSDNAASDVIFEKRKTPKIRTYETTVDPIFCEPSTETEEEENLLFFRSLLPQMKQLDEIETLEFRHHVQSLLIKTLKTKKHKMEMFSRHYSDKRDSVFTSHSVRSYDDSIDNEPISFVTKTEVNSDSDQYINVVK